VLEKNANFRSKGSGDSEERALYWFDVASNFITRNVFCQTVKEALVPLVCVLCAPACSKPEKFFGYSPPEFQTAFLLAEEWSEKEGDERFGGEKAIKGVLGPGQTLLPHHLEETLLEEDEREEELEDLERGDALFRSCRAGEELADIEQMKKLGC
jgi:hypothetical protein